MRNTDKICPHCGMIMKACDYSPLYGYSWLHPKSTSTGLCPLSETLVFNTTLDTITKKQKEKQ